MRTTTLAVLLAATALLGPESEGVRAKADRIVIDKSERTLWLTRGGHVVQTYKVALGSSPEGPKRCEGDGRTPEGTYRVVGRNAKSAYHRSLRISYPGPADLARSRTLGCSAGGDIMIHGITNGLGWIGARHRTIDWTAGCIAVTDEEIEEIWDSVPDGTAVEIRP